MNRSALQISDPEVPVFDKFAMPTEWEQVVNPRNTHLLTHQNMGLWTLP